MLASPFLGTSLLVNASMRWPRLIPAGMVAALGVWPLLQVGPIDPAVIAAESFQQALVAYGADPEPVPVAPLPGPQAPPLATTVAEKPWAAEEEPDATTKVMGAAAWPPANAQEPRLMAVAQRKQVAGMRVRPLPASSHVTPVPANSDQAASPAWPAQIDSAAAPVTPWPEDSDGPPAALTIDPAVAGQGSGEGE